MRYFKTIRGEYLMIEKYYNTNGDIGIIVSGGYGAGWSTWLSSHKEFLMMDKTLVEMCIQCATEEEVAAYLQNQFGEDFYCYMGGWDDCRIVNLPPNTAFKITEYDGSESLLTIDDLPFNTGE